MTLIGKIFRPWDLTSSSTEEEKSVDKNVVVKSEVLKPGKKLKKPKKIKLYDDEEDDDKKPSSNSNSNFEKMALDELSPLMSNFLFPQSLNELASLSRVELTAMGLLQPEPHNGHGSKVKRQRPKRFHCPHCQVAFSNNGQLKGHVRIHTGERPFLCEEESCKKSFTRNEELTRHKRIHSGVRPYPCTFCGKKFGRKDHLKKHSRTHQRLLFGPFCPAPFGQPGPSNPTFDYQNNPIFSNHHQINLNHMNNPVNNNMYPNNLNTLYNSDNFYNLHHSF